MTIVKATRFPKFRPKLASAQYQAELILLRSPKVRRQQCITVPSSILHIRRLQFPARVRITEFENYSSGQTFLRQSSLRDLQKRKQFITGTNSKFTPPGPNPPLQSTLGSWTVIIAGFVVILYTLSLTSTADIERFVKRKPISFTSEGTSRIPETTDVYNELEMPEFIQQPGRVGNLTSEEEEKLKEFWAATLQVFGVLDKEAYGTAESINSKDKSGTADSKKPKKKRISLFRRSKDDSSADPAASETKGSADEDKYGQTKEYQEALATLSPETLRTTFWSTVKADHPDALLLRFLRARKWDIEKAMIMMISTMKWRSKDVHVDDDIMLRGELGMLDDSNGDDPIKKKIGAGFLEQMRMGKSFLHGVDKDGRPISLVRARLHKAGEQNEESLERFTIFTIETARLLVAQPADTACIIFDLTGFSLANMDYAPVKFMVKCFEANYPESLGAVLVHKAPWVFQGIWKIIKGWLDPVVASKVHFTSNNQELEEFVARSNIIKELGGDEDWTYQYIEPVPNENDKMKDTETRDKLLKEREVSTNAYEKDTLEWIHATGIDTTSIKERRHATANDLRASYWVLDPYIRARSLYDRCGIIAGGNTQFYLAKPEEVAQKTLVTPIPPVSPAPNGSAIAPIATSADDLD